MNISVNYVNINLRLYNNFYKNAKSLYTML